MKIDLEEIKKELEEKGYSIVHECGNTMMFSYVYSADDSEDIVIELFCEECKKTEEYSVFGL